MTLRVLFLHGLEGSPTGLKARRLRAMPGVEVVAPTLPTEPVLAFREAHGPGHPVPPEVTAPSLEVARRALLEGKPDVVVGSSFGGGLALWLAVKAHWEGPLVLLAPAGARLFALGHLPPRPGRVVIVHGRGDDVVPMGDSVRLAEASRCDVQLWLVDDTHALGRSVASGVLDEAVLAAAGNHLPKEDRAPGGGVG
jgi:pimeloyl-ACP methyl ester carboxylesterase